MVGLCTYVVTTLKCLGTTERRAVKKIVTDILKEAECEVGGNAINGAHRIGPKKSKDGQTTQQICVRFNSFMERTKVNRSRKKLHEMLKVTNFDKVY